MISLVSLLNQLSGTVFGWLLMPLHWMGPWGALIVISVLSGLFMLWVYKRFSNQDAIRHYKDKIRGNLLGVRLYQHDVAIVLRLQGAILKDTFKYIGLSLSPVLVLLLPLTLILIQLNYHFDLRPLDPGRSTLIQARFDAKRLDVTAVPLGLDGEALEIETFPVRIRQQGEVTWRVKFIQEGSQEIGLRVGNDRFVKKVEVGSTWKPVSRLRSQSFLDLLLYPGETPLDPSQALLSVEVRHPRLPLTLAGWNIHWLVSFFLISILAAFLLKGVFGVEL